MRPGGSPGSSPQPLPTCSPPPLHIPWVRSCRHTPPRGSLRPSLLPAPDPSRGPTPPPSPQGHFRRLAVHITALAGREGSRVCHSPERPPPSWKDPGTLDGLSPCKVLAPAPSDPPAGRPCCCTRQEKELAPGPGMVTLCCLGSRPGGRREAPWCPRPGQRLPYQSQVTCCPLWRRSRGGHRRLTYWKKVPGPLGSDGSHSPEVAGWRVDGGGRGRPYRRGSAQTRTPAGQRRRPGL